MFIITGGAGFIGSALLERFASAGVRDLVVVDNLGASEKWKNLVGKPIEDYIHKDQFLKYLVPGPPSFKPEAVIHLGACSSTVEKNADYMIENNYRYSGRVAEWCLSHKVRLIYASSAATYGDGKLGFSDSDEVTEKLRPLNIYGYSKQLFDIWALRTGNFRRVVGLKFFNVYGPNEYHKGDMRSVVCKAFEQVQSSGKVKLFSSQHPDYKDGEQLRDFVYVKDCVDVIWWFLENSSTAGLFNLGSGKARSWNDLVRAVFSALKRKDEIEYIDMPGELSANYQYKTEAVLDRLRSVGCDIEFRDLEAGVSDYVTNYLTQENRYL